MDVATYVTHSNLNISVTGSGTNYGLWLLYGTIGGTPELRIVDSQISATGSGTNYGVQARLLLSDWTGQVDFDNSRIAVEDAGNNDYTIDNVTNFRVNVGLSQLIGPVTGTGTKACVHSFKGDYTSLSATCG
jgi:hypothetical protein